MQLSSNYTSSKILTISTISTTLSLLNNNISLNINDHMLFEDKNLTCFQIKYQYVSQKSLFNFVRYITQNLNRFFILPAIILNLCAFYILRRTRMNRSSSIAFYMQILALCDIAFFSLRVIFEELSSLSTNKHILTTGLCRFLFLMVNAAVFSLAHIFFKNTLVMLLTFVGGLLFALTFKKTKSTLLVTIEHAIYGCWLFTVGMGEMLGFPS